MEEILKKIWSDLKNRSIFFGIAVIVISIFFSLVVKGWAKIVRSNMEELSNFLFSGKFSTIAILAIFIVNIIFYNVKPKKILGILWNFIFILLISEIRNYEYWGNYRFVLVYMKIIFKAIYLIYMALAMQEKVGNGFFLKEVFNYSRKKQIVYPLFICGYFYSQLSTNFIFKFQIKNFLAVINFNFVEMTRSTYLYIPFIVLFSVVIYGILKYADEDEIYKKIGSQFFRYYLKILSLFAIVGYIGIKLYQEEINLGIFIVVIATLYYIVKSMKIRGLFELLDVEVNKNNNLKNIVIVAILGVIGYYLINFLDEFELNNLLLKPNSSVTLIIYIFTYILLFRVDMIFIKNSLVETKKIINKKVRIFLAVILTQLFVELIMKIKIKIDLSEVYVLLDLGILIGVYLLIELYIVDYLVEKNKKIKTFF